MDNDTPVKMTALCCLTVCFCLSIVVAVDSPQIWGSVLGIMAGVLGLGTVVKNATKHILRIDK